MNVYRYCVIFFAGTFAANAVPHYVSGITGQSFPSPFGDPPGFGDSSPLTNVFWGSANIALAYLLARHGRFTLANRVSVTAFYLGVVGVGIMLSQAFGDRA